MFRGRTHTPSPPEEILLQNIAIVTVYGLPLTTEARSPRALAGLASDIKKAVAAVPAIATPEERTEVLFVPTIGYNGHGRAPHIVVEIRAAFDDMDPGQASTLLRNVIERIAKSGLVRDTGVITGTTEQLTSSRTLRYTVAETFAAA